MRMWQVLLTRTVGPWCLCALFYTQMKVLHFVWKIIWQGWYVMFNSSWAPRLFFAPTRQRCQAIIVCWCLVQEYNLFFLGPLSRCRERKHLMIINLYCLSFPMGMEWRKKKIPISTFCRLYIIQPVLRIRIHPIRITICRIRIQNHWMENKISDKMFKKIVPN